MKAERPNRECEHPIRDSAHREHARYYRTKFPIFVTSEDNLNFEAGPTYLPTDTVQVLISDRILGCQSTFPALNIRPACFAVSVFIHDSVCPEEDVLGLFVGVDLPELYHHLPDLTH